MENSSNHGDSRYHSKEMEESPPPGCSHFGKPGRTVRYGRGGIDQKTGYKPLEIHSPTLPSKIADDQRFVYHDSRNWQTYSYVEPGNNYAIQFAYQYRQNISKSDKDTRKKDEAGNYTILDEQYSKRLENNFTNQEIELNFQSVRQQYDYTVGFSIQPSSSQSKTFVGENMISVTRDVVNYAPTAQFNYRWSRQHNLRLRYFGNTEQPSVTQLSPVVDVSNPLNITYGNPDLKPSFTHRLNLRYQNFIPEKNSSMGFFGDFRYLTTISFHPPLRTETGRRETTYENVAGNWNANGRMMLNVPLKNIRFSIFSHDVCQLQPCKRILKPEKNLSHRLNFDETLGLNYRSDLIDFESVAISTTIR